MPAPGNPLGKAPSPLRKENFPGGHPDRVSAGRSMQSRAYPWPLAESAAVFPENKGGVDHTAAYGARFA